MRLLLTLMATAILAVSIGCDSKTDDEKKPETTATGGGSAQVDAPDDGGEKTDVATAKTEGTQTVSLKLPGMT